MTKRHLYTGQPGTSSASVYTSTGQVTSIFAASVCNPTGSGVTLDVWRIPNGGTVSDASKIYHSKSVAANESGEGLQLLINVTLEVGDELHMQASTADAITVSLSGEVG